MTEDEKANAVLDLLVGITRCPSCRFPMTHVPERPYSRLSAGWHCNRPTCYVVFVDLEGRVIDPPTPSFAQRRTYD